MAGTAVDTGQAILTGALTGILNALGGGDDDIREPLPAPVTQPQRMGLIAGMSVGTIALLAVGAYAIFKLAK